MKYVFGVMSNKWELEAEDNLTAYIAISIHVGQNIPIACYSPHNYAFMPADILANNPDMVKPSVLRACMKTIKEVKR